MIDTPRHRRPFAAFLGLLAAISMLVATPMQAHAAVFTWTGSASGLWSNPANWGGVTPPNGSDLVFPAGASNPSTTDDIASLTVNNITFSGQGYAVNPSGGPSLTVSGGISDTSAASGACDTVFVPFTATAATFTLTTSSGFANLCLDAPITGGASALDVTGPGVVQLGAVNTFASATVDAGTANSTLGITVNGALGAGTVTIGATATHLANLNLNGVTLANAITLQGDITAASGTNVLNGAVTLSPPAGHFASFVTNTNGTGNFDINGVISGASPNFFGQGIIRLFGSNAITGGIIIGNGVFATGLIAENTSALGSAVVNVQDTSSLVTNLAAAGTFSNNLILHGTGSIFGGALDVNGNTTTFSGTVNLATPPAMVLMSGAVNDTITGVVSGSAGLQVSKAGSLTLQSGGNTDTGAVDVVNGQLGCFVTAGNCTAATQYTIESNGRLLLGGAAQLLAASTMLINGTGTFDMNSQTQTIATLTFNGAAGTVFDGNLTVTGGVQSTGTSVTSRIGVNPGAGTLNISATPTMNVAAGGATPDLTVNLVMTGANGLTKLGNGILDLIANNTYAGNTSVNAGTLWVDGSQPASPVSVAAGATLGGTGTVGAVTSTGGTISPGHSPGILTTGALTLDSASTYVAEINGTTVGTQYDQIHTTGVPSLGNSSLNATFGFSPVVGQTFTIIRNTSGVPVNGIFGGKPEGAIFLASGVVVQITYVGGGGNDVVLTALGSAASSTTLTSSQNPATEGQSVTLTAVVSSGGVTIPTGTVHFSDGTTTLGDVVLDGSGRASLTTSALASGNRTITATYSGSLIFAPSSGVLSQVVNAVPVPVAGAGTSLPSPSVLGLGLGGLLAGALVLGTVFRSRRRGHREAVSPVS